MKGSHEQVLREMSLLNEQLKREQNKCLSLQHELRSGNASQRIVLEVSPCALSFILLKLTQVLHI